MASDVILARNIILMIIRVQGYWKILMVSMNVQIVVGIEAIIKLVKERYDWVYFW